MEKARLLCCILPDSSGNKGKVEHHRKYERKKKEKKKIIFLFDFVFFSQFFIWGMGGSFRTASLRSRILLWRYKKKNWEKEHTLSEGFLFPSRLSFFHFLLFLRSPFPSPLSVPLSFFLLFLRYFFPFLLLCLSSLSSFPFEERKSLTSIITIKKREKRHKKKNNKSFFLFLFFLLLPSTILHCCCLRLWFFLLVSFILFIHSVLLFRAVAISCRTSSPSW